MNEQIKTTKSQMRQFIENRFCLILTETIFLIVDNAKYCEILLIALLF